MTKYYTPCSTCGTDYPDAMLDVMEDIEGLHCYLCRTHTRTCTTCNKEYPHNRAYFYTNGEKGLRSICKVCQNKEVMRRYKLKKKKGSIPNAVPS